LGDAIVEELNSNFTQMSINHIFPFGGIKQTSDWMREVLND